MRLLILLFISLSASLYSQQNQSNHIISQSMELDGPRIGVTFLSNSFINSAKNEADVKLTPFVSQFGWQFEKRFFSHDNGATGISEWIVLVGGFEQDLFLPSLSWIVEGRTIDGFEIGAGPNLSASGTAMVIAAGVTIKSGGLNFPINVAVATSKGGPRFSLLFGFNISKTKRVVHRRS